MLEVVNRHLHGFVAVSLAGAARDAGIFLRLRSGPVSAEDLSADLGLNPGYCRIVLRGLLGLGWVESHDLKTFSATPAAEGVRHIPTDWVQLYGADYGAFFDRGEAGAEFSRWFAASETAWGGADAALHELLDAPLAVQLMLETARRNRGRPAAEIGARLEQTVHPRARPALLQWMRARGLVEAKGSTQLTERGSYLYERALTMGVTGSYRPMLRQLGTLLSGNPAAVLGRDAGGHETYVDRLLNVVGSGFQHNKYFAEMAEQVVAIFDREPLAAQPIYVADTGCGDGALLKTLYTAIAERSLRGRHLSEFPLRMIGVDYNQRSLEASAAMLAGIPHMLLRGDISDPARIMADLFARGVAHEDEVLHVRSFLDHDRPTWIEPGSTAGFPDDDHVYVSRTGKALGTAEIFDELVRHLSRWSEVLGVHGLLFLEVFSLPVALTRRYFAEAESFSFDIYHALSRQTLVEAGVFQQALAAAGLYPQQQSLSRFPRTMPYSRIVLQHVKPQDFRVRALRRVDIPALLEIDRLCWPENLRTSEAEILARHHVFAVGQFVIEQQGRPAGVLYTQRIADLEQVLAVPVSDYLRLHEREGRFWQLLGISVHPHFQGFALGDRLLEHVLDLAALTPGIEAIYGVTRCLNFQSVAMPFDQYIRLVDGQGRPRDPLLRFHQSHGAAIERAVPGARPADLDNQGNGVLISYAVAERFGRARCGAGSASAPKAAVAEAVRLLMRDPAVYDAERPLRELGLDSMSLMELRILLNDRLGLEFEPGFFFNYPTPAAIVDFVLSRGVAEAPVAQVAAAALPAAVQDQAEPRQPIGSADDDIAIVGMSLRLPGGIDSPASYWKMLMEGRCIIGRRPETRWREFSEELSRLGPELDHINHGGFLDDIDRFDASFFHITPLEARALDPQQRLLLELAWESLESAGIDPQRLAGHDVGAFLGAYTRDYEAISLKGRALRDIDAYFGTGNALSTAAGRLAYFFDFRGPTMTVDTACSSSSCAIYSAVRSLRDGSAELALAGGVNMMMTPVLSVAFARANMLSIDGLCKTFDAGANGYVRGEGAAMLVLKRLSDAERDGDPVRAVIKAAELMQDGRTNGLTAPNGRAQVNIIRRALAKAGRAPSDISYVEAHGTATRIGDPVEMEALREAYCESERTVPLAVGSVKTNIGHTEAVSGMAGLIKVVLAMENRTIPAHLHLREVSNLLHLPASIEIPTKARPWDAVNGMPRAAGISSYGFSGSNTHIIVEEYLAPEAPSRAAPASPRHALPFIVSGKTETALRSNLEAVAAFADKEGEALDLAALSATLTRGRAHHARRAAFAFTSAADLRTKLVDARASTPPLSPVPRIAFMFTGQGAQYHGMARRLSEQSPAFRASLDRCNALVCEQAGVPLFDILWGDRALLDQTRYAQVALFCVEYSLAELLRQAGIEASVVLGHSVGEFGAACYAGVIDPEVAIRLLCRRGALMQEGTGAGAMAAVLATPEQVDELVHGRSRVTIAARNGPRNQVVSGDPGEVAAVEAAAEAKGYSVFRLPVTRAFHSPLMEPILEEFRSEAAAVVYRAQRIPLISNLDGEVREEPFSADYWVDHIRRPVEFDRAVKTLVHSGVAIVVEIGPKPTLTNLASVAAGRAPIEWLSTLQGQEAHGLATLFARVAAAGVDVNWSVYPQAGGRVLTDLPTYRFDRSSYWIAPVQGAPAAPNRSAAGHIVDGEWIFPASGYVAAALAAAAGLSSEIPRLVTFEFRHRLKSSGDNEPVLRTAIVNGLVTIEALDQSGGDWIACASCAIAGSPASPDMQWVVLNEPVRRLSGNEFYAALGRCGYDYSGAFRALRSVSFGKGEAVAELAAQEFKGAQDAFVAPSTLDACFQVALTSLLDEGVAGLDGRILLPIEIGAATVHAALTGTIRVHCRYRSVARGIAADLQIAGTDGRRLAEVTGLVFAAVPRRTVPGLEPMAVRWEALPPVPPARLGGRWLVLDDETGCAGAFAEALRDASASVHLIAASFPRKASAGAELNSLLVRLAAALEEPAEGLVCCWPAAAPRGDRGVAAVLLPLLQFIGSLPRHRLGRVLFVTLDAQSVSGGDLGGEEGGAAAWGMVAAYRAETGTPTMSAIDLPAGEADPSKLRSFAAAALAQITSPAAAAMDVAVRAEGTFVQRLRRADLGAIVPVGAGAAYVITGGLGALGRLAAEYLHACGAGRILLLGRSVGARPGWVEALDRTRACIEIACCDVTDREAVAAAAGLLGDLPVRGLIHAAGITADAALAGQGEERLAHVYAPKLSGARNLLAAFPAETLDFVWLFSSLVGTYGGAGQINYAAANAALDAHARWLRARGAPAVSVAWGPWSGAGMASKLARQESLAARMFADPLPLERSSEAFDALRRVCGPQVVIASWRRDLIDRTADLPAPLISLRRGPAATVARRSVQRKPLQSMRSVKALIANCISVVSGVELEAVYEAKALADLGIDSLMYLQLSEALEKVLDVSIEVVTMFSLPTLAAVTEYVVAHSSMPAGDTAAHTSAARLPTSQANDLGADLDAIEALDDEALKAMLGGRPFND